MIGYIVKDMETEEYFVFTTNSFYRPREKVRVGQNVYQIVAYA